MQNPFSLRIFLLYNVYVKIYSWRKVMALNTFSNGLRLVSVQRPEKKVACVVLHIAGGTQSEKNYQSGISAYLTKIMLMGTKQHGSAYTLMHYAKSNGIILTPHSSKESITISAVCPREKIEVAIALLSEIAFDTLFTSEAGDEAREIQLSDVSMLSENPSFIMDKMINATLYSRTGLANPKHGSNISVSRFRAIDAKDYLERVFTPRNTIISVVGDMSGKDAYELVKTYFFDRMKESDAEYKKLKYVSKVDEFEGVCKGRIKRLNQTRISVAFPTVSFKDNERYLLEIIKPILLKNVRIALSNHNYFFDTKINTKYYANNGFLAFELSVDYDHAKEHLFNFIKAINNDIKTHKISTDEFETEKKVYVTKFIEMYDSVLENALISAKMVALTKQTFSESSERMKIELLTSSDANKLLKNILDFTKMVVVYLGRDIHVEYEDIAKQID